MGLQPIPRVAPTPDRESFHLGMAKRAFVNGNLTIEQYEAAVWHVLNGGHLTRSGIPVISVEEATERARQFESRNTGKVVRG